MKSLYARFRGLVHEVAKFGIVGLFAYVIDVGLFNVLCYGWGPFLDKPLTSKIASVIVATTFAFFGNKYWTFRDRNDTGLTREYILFFVMNGVAMLIALLCLWVSHYLMGLTSPLADNVSANIVGLVLGTLFRFWSYRTIVFPHSDSNPPEGE